MRSNPWYFVILLAILYVVSYVDRLILTLLVEPIKADIALTDVQMGLLIGPAFAILFAAIGIPIAWIVDRGNRKRLLVIGVALWSVSTLLAGSANSFATLFVLRMGLALGESVLSPVALSLIGDMFPPGKRSAPSAAFVAAGTTGVMLAYVIGGGIIQLADNGGLAALPVIGSMDVWRQALVLVGIPGLVLALIVQMTTREAARGGTKVSPDAEIAPASDQFGIFESRREMVRHYACFFIGNAFLGMMLYGSLSWYPTHLIRTQGVTAAQAGYLFSTALAIGVLLTLALPMLSERIARTGRRDLLLFVPVVAIPIGTVLFIAALLQDSLAASSVLLALGFSMLSSVNAFPAISIPQTAPPAIRGRLVAVIQFCNNIGGLSVGSFAVAFLSERVFDGAGSLGQALLAVAVVTAPIAWILFIMAWLPYRAAVQRNGAVKLPPEAVALPNEDMVTSTPSRTDQAAVGASMVAR